MTTFKSEMKHGTKFWLGPIVRSHEIGNYQFIEYRERIFSPNPNAGELSGKNRFSAFVKGKGISRSYESLDAALVGVVAYCRDGCNTRADRYFMKATEPDAKE